MSELEDKIIQLKKQKNALILAHFYQTLDIQNIADHVGDSFELAKYAQKATQAVIVLCGVTFMAESAKILNPDKTVLLPVPDAGCPMADMVTPEDVKALKEQYPDAAVMCYINSSAAVKAECDICCTSSSAVKIAKVLPQKQIIFVPDQNLGAYVASQVPEKEFILFHGFCPTHHRVSVEDVMCAKAAYPDAMVLIHPECTTAVLRQADYIGSTSGIIKQVEQSDQKAFIIGTELGVAERLRQLYPEKQIHLLTDKLICPNMKKTHLRDVFSSLENNVYEIKLSQNEMEGAKKSLERMINV